MIDQKKLQRVVRLSLTLGLCATLAACGGGGDANSTSAAVPVAVVVATPVVAVMPESSTDRSQPSQTLAPQAATSAPAPMPAPMPATTTVAAPMAPNPADQDSCGLNGANGIQAELLHRVNALRTAGAVCGSTIYRATGPVNWNNLLLRAASGHSSDMASNNHFSHVGSAGSTLTSRIAAAGYAFSAAGENIAAGQPTVEAVMRSWINSPGHCQNLMNPKYQDVAVACKRNDASSYGLYWTMVLGRP